MTKKKKRIWKQVLFFCTKINKKLETDIFIVESIKEETVMKYPYDIVSYVRQKTFSVEAHFCKETEDSPLKVFNDFSRFVLTVISESKAATCNLHIEDVAGITEKTKYAFNKYMESKNACPSGNNTPAFTTRFSTGSLKGKSPAEVMMESGSNGRKILHNQYEFLKKNLEKYPNNQKLIDAIKEAVDIDYSNIDVPASNIAPVTILDINCRPLIRKKREDGMSFCYECKVIFDAARKYPVSCTVTNYYAPVEKLDNGLLNVLVKQKDVNSILSNEFDMTAEEWLNAVEAINMSKQAFYMVNFSSAYKFCEDAVTNAINKS